MDKMEMKRWSADHIQIWGRHVALNDSIVNKFYENDINGSRLFSLDAGKLKKMGITNAEDRDKVLSEISRLHLLGPSLPLQKEIDDSKLSLTRLAVDTTNTVTSRLTRVADGISKSVAFLKRFSKPKDKEKNSEKTSLSSPPSFSSSSSVFSSVSTVTDSQQHTHTQTQAQQSVFSSSSSMHSHHSQSFVVTASSRQTKTNSQRIAEKFRRTVSGDLLKHELPHKSVHLRAQYAAAHGDPSKLSQSERRTTELMRAALTHEDSFKNSLLDSQIDSENGDNDEFLLPTNTAIYIPPFSVLHHVFQHNESESTQNSIHEPTWHGALHRVMKGQYDLEEIEKQLQETVTVRVAKRRSTVNSTCTGYRMQRAHNNSLDPSVCRKPSTPVISADDLPLEPTTVTVHNGADDSKASGSCAESIQVSKNHIANDHECASPSTQPLNGLTAVTLSPDIRSDSSTQVESSPSIDGSRKSQHVAKRLSSTFDDLDQFYDTEQLEHSIEEVEEIEI